MTPYSQNRDCSIDILKGIGIILMVVGHSGCPKIIHDYIYTFHMPLFFMASGFFITEKNVQNIWVFIVKKIKGIYVPFVLCSLTFLLFHNIFFDIGLINDKYGTVEGYTSFYYSIRDIVHNLIKILVIMDGYEPFLLGAYWFLRALFFSSIILCLGTWLINIKLKSISKSILCLSIVCFLLGGVLKYMHVQIPFIAQGGYREMIGVFFMSAGYFMRMYRKYILSSGNTLIFVFLISIIAFLVHPASLELSCTIRDWMLIPISGISGTIIIYWLSTKCESNKSSIIVAYIGRKSIWILTLHFVMFKLSEIVEVIIYDLPVQMIGCHPIIPPMDNWFFCFHTIVAVTLPTTLAYLITRKQSVKFFLIGKAKNTQIIK